MGPKLGPAGWVVDVHKSNGDSFVSSDLLYRFTVPFLAGTSLMAWSNCSISESMSEEFIFRSTLNWRGHELARDRPAHPLLFPPQEIHSTAVGRATIARNHDRLCLFWTFLRRISSFHFAKWKCSPHSPPIAPVRLSIDGACFYCPGCTL